MNAPGFMELLDWRRRIAGLYAAVRALRAQDTAAAHTHWRDERDRLFAAHPQSPLDEEHRGDFEGLVVADYNPALVFTAHVDPAPREDAFEIPLSGEGTMRFARVGVVHLPVGSLDVFWLQDYGGGVFLPFRDATAGDTTYGGGRYLLDTAKGADLGSQLDGSLVLDFNYAYNPSCHYSPVWSCPLPPPGNALDVRIEAGELAFPG